MVFLKRHGRIAGGLILAALVGACASPGSLPPAQIADPFEPTNRAVFAVNSGFNKVVTFPLVQGYEFVVPAPVRQALANGTANLNEPTVFMNNLLQGRFEASTKTFGRFLVNSTLGVGGLIDIATLGGLPKQTGDFGQTLFVWGVNDSPFVLIPFLGPSTFRDAIGFGIDSLASPGGYAIYRVGGRLPTYALFGFETIRRAKDLQSVDDTAIDPYIRLRTVFYQTRRRELLDGIGRKDEIFDPLITDGGAAPAATPPTRPRSRAGNVQR